MELRIKELAKQRGIKIADLAASVNVSRRTMYNWIDGNITLDGLIEVAAALKCSVYELMEPTDGLSFIYDEAGNFKGLSK